MGLTQSKPISTDPKIANKPVWHVWTVKTPFLQAPKLYAHVCPSWQRTISNLIH